MGFHGRDFKRPFVRGTKTPARIKAKAELSVEEEATFNSLATNTDRPVPCQRFDNNLIHFLDEDVKHEEENSGISDSDRRTGLL